MYNHVQAIAGGKEHTGEKEVRNEAIREALAVGFGYFHSICALSGCGKKDDGPVSMKGYASGVEAATEEETNRQRKAACIR